MENQRSVTTAFVIGGLASGYLVRSALRSVMGNFATEDQMIAGVLPVSMLIGIVAGLVGFFVLLRNERAVLFTDSVVTELESVTWPDREETIGNTGIVVGATVFFSVLLAVYDFGWAKLTEIFLYSPG